MTTPLPEVPSLPPAVPRVEMPVAFVGNRSALFWLALKTGFWTILTLGFYRFWMKTRLRRWYWSSIRPGGTPMEYVGDPWEKLLGFFIAVVILTFYIGIVNLILMFISFSVFNSSWIGYLSSFLGVIPLWFYATYRARRYVLGRTRWRGVRFGLEPAAWSYTWRALVHWLITICSAGLLWPRMTFYLEKFRSDRTFFGSAKLHQGGHWTMLYRAARPLIIILVLIMFYGLWLVFFDPMVAELDDWADLPDTVFNPLLLARMQINAPWRLWLLIPLALLLIFGIIYYRFDAKRILANHKTAPGVTFQSKLKGARITMIYVLGNFIAYLILIMGIGTIIGVAIAAFGPDVLIEEQLGGSNPLDGLPRYIAFVLIAVMYLGIFLLWGVLYNAFVTYPLMRHMAITTSLPHTSGLADVSQRARDEFAEAEGFAEALDLGAAI